MYRGRDKAAAHHPEFLCRDPERESSTKGAGMSDLSPRCEQRGPAQLKSQRDVALGFLALRPQPRGVHDPVAACSDDATGRNSSHFDGS